ncbi:hypothetical protein XENOCAPTIV_018177 [Xenoophorus captivus]|uniref:Uncharacterized protein n=1 Tax=Xenoophorus captivus TaxID=1517983 RepID=A0ABV0S2P9_9TELE
MQPVTVRPGRIHPTCTLLILYKRHYSGSCYAEAERKTTTMADTVVNVLAAVGKQLKTRKIQSNIYLLPQTLSTLATCDVIASSTAHAGHLSCMNVFTQEITTSHIYLEM